MQITVTNTSANLVALLSSANLALATNNKGGALEYRVTLYNADTTPTDIVYYAYGETATASQGLPIFAPASASVLGGSVVINTGDLTKINLISNVASAIVNVIIEPSYRRI